LVFFNDKLIYSLTFPCHLIHLYTILNLLVINQFLVKLSKCNFVITNVSYLDHIILSQGVTQNLEKALAIINRPQL